MMKKALKRFLVVSCTVALLMTTPGMEVLADEMQEEEVVLSDISESESMQEELPEEVIQEYDDEDYIDDSAENLEAQVPDISDNVEVEDSEKIVIEEVEEEPVAEDASNNSQEDELEDNETLVGADYVESGACGDNVYWGTTLNEDGETYTLTIYGQGEMRDYDFVNHKSWYSERVSEAIIESGVTSIGNHAFSGCNGLISVMIPNSVTSIGSSAFSGCSSLTSVMIPDSVTSIGSSAFFGCSSLTSIALPDTVPSIREKAFYECNSLTSIALPDSVTSIGYQAFCGCGNLTSITIPNSVTSIGFQAFCGCGNLTSITIPNSVTSIEDSVFSGCGSLTSITIPVYLKSIGYSAFSDCTSLTSIKIPECIKSIGYLAFSGCSSLTNIEIPDSATTIGNELFRGCNNLRNVKIPSNCVKYNMFDGCSKIEKLEVTSTNDLSWTLEKEDEEGYLLNISGKGEMKDYSRYSSNSSSVLSPWRIIGFHIKNVIIENGVTSIGAYAFCKCDLTSIVIPSSVTSIGKGAFIESKYLKSIIIPKNVTSIKNETFRDCEGLTSIKIPESVRGIGQFAFCGCSSLLSITIPDNVTIINQETFRGCSSLISITIPDSVGRIEQSAFSDCTNLISIKIPEKVSDLKPGLFSGCSSLESMTLNGTFKTIGANSFKALPALKEVVISAPVEEIGNNAFGSCTSLQKISLPDTLKTISNSAFSNCTSLVKIIIPENVQSVGSDVFAGCMSLETLILNGTYTTIEGYKYKQLDALKEVIINAPVNEIGGYAFSSCPNLKTIRLPGTLKNVREGAFRFDSSLSTVYFYGTNAQWNAINIEDYNEPLLNANIIKISSNDISRATIYTKSASYPYTGTPRNPKPIIHFGNKTLVSGTDYTLTYKNDLNVGTATVTATGKGKYTGTISCKYGITPRDIGDGTASTKSPGYVYTGAPRHPAMILVVNSKTQVKDKDYTLSYENDVEVGIATVTAKGIGNYKGTKSCTFLITEKPKDISGCSIAGNSLSYGYSGKAYTPAVTVKLDGVTLTKDTDYTVAYKNNKEPGTATITITGIGKYTGTRSKTFEIVDCVSSLVSGKTYQLIPKNNSKTAVSSFGGRMVNNTKIYITDRSNSEAMKFKAIKNADGTWKFINAKCEMAFAVRSNSSDVGKELVLYDQTTRKQQNWKLTKKSDNSFGIINAVSGLYVAMSDDSAVKGTTLSMEENSGRGQQRFYIAETTAVSAPFDGTRAVKASKNKNYAVSIASASKEDGANVNLAAYSSSNDKKFNIIYSGGGYYRLVNVNSKMVLTVKNNSTANGANVIQSVWAGESGQRWKFKKNADGTVTLTNALGTVLHLNGNSTTNGTNIQAKAASTTGAQKWYLE